jgi:predicted aspartyl protease
VGNAVFVQATIEGTTANLLVDSGASTSLILDRTVANRMGLSTKAHQNLKGAGKDACPASRLPETGVKLGHRTVPAPDAFASDLAPIASFLKHPVDGVIGGELFRGQIVTLDFSRDLLLLSAHRNDSPQQLVVPMVSLGGLCCAIEAELEVNGRTIRGKFVLDTGAPTIALALTRSFADKMKLLPNEKLQPVIRLPALCGPSQLGKFPSQVSLRLGDRQFPVGLWIGLDREGSLNEARFDGVLGGEFFARFREVTFDVPGKKLILKK